VPWARRLPELWERRRHSARGSSSAQGPLPAPLLRPAQPEAARRVVPAVRLSAQVSERRHSEAALVRRDAAMAPSWFRQAAEQRLAALSEPGWWQVPVTA
jgi:hypothetical protein